MARLRAAAAATAAVVGLIAAAVKAGAVAWLLRVRAVVLLAKSAWNMSLGSVLEPGTDRFHELCSHCVERVILSTCGQVQQEVLVGLEILQRRLAGQNR